ncbi:MAG TPA: DUF459 domain-containing protein [Actinomycetota bacterium]|nr:DUF459 domain-containing protein [Actinomycetota bacterium]
MAIETFDPQTDEDRAEGDDEVRARPRLVGAWQAGVALGVCLLLWTLLAAPILERNASAGPVGARRTAALAVLRPFVAIAGRIGLLSATGSVERALGDDPDAQAGGELVLPEFDLPPEVLGRTPVAPVPSAQPTTEPEPRDQAEGGRDETERDDPPPEPEGIREPTSTNKLRVAVVGDSLSQGLGPAIERWMDPGVVRVLSLGRQSTGLSRQDYFNWQAGMRQIVEEFRPDLVFILLGSNDAQAQIAPSGAAIPVGSIEWVQGYRDQAERLLSEATGAGTRVVWVGIPIVEDRDRWDFYRRVNDVYRQVAQDDPLATYLDAWSLFRAKDGGYRAFVRNERGLLQEMRAPDGIHFTPNGYAFLGRMALRTAAESFDLPQRAVIFRL